jgi:hypothetical protein
MLQDALVYLDEAARVNGVARRADQDRIARCHRLGKRASCSAERRAKLLRIAEGAANSIRAHHEDMRELARKRTLVVETLAELD